MPMQGVISSSSERLLHSGVSQVIELFEALWSRLLGVGVRAGLLAASNRSVALETRRGSAHSDGGGSSTEDLRSNVDSAPDDRTYAQQPLQLSTAVHILSISVQQLSAILRCHQPTSRV